MVEMALGEVSEVVMCDKCEEMKRMLEMLVAEARWYNAPIPHQKEIEKLIDWNEEEKGY